MYSNTVKFPAQLFLYALNEKRQHAQTAGLFPPYFVTFSQESLINSDFGICLIFSATRLSQKLSIHKVLTNFFDFLVTKNLCAYALVSINQ
jgi:hypothetical protein